MSANSAHGLIVVLCEATNPLPVLLSTPLMILAGISSVPLILEYGNKKGLVCARGKGRTGLVFFSKSIPLLIMPKGTYPIVKKEIY